MEPSHEAVPSRMSQAAAGELKAVWENLGRIDPLWAIMSDPERRYGGWDLGEFMATGEQSVRYLIDTARTHGMPLDGRVLDFGCGVGRISNALAEQGLDVVGIDIAASMIEQAEELNSHRDRLRFVAYDGNELPFPDNSFDAAVTLIVLQHCPPRVQVTALMQLQRVVRPGGLLIFQLPSRAVPVEPLDEAARRAGIDWRSELTELPVQGTSVILTEVTNQSDRVWPAGRQIKLGNHWYRGDTVVRWDDARADLPHDVAPGETVELKLTVNAPSAAGEYRLELDMVQDFVGWWVDSGTQPVSREIRVLDAPAQPSAEQDSPEVQEPGDEGTVVGGMEMHAMTIELVTALLTHCGHEVVAAVPDDFAGPEWESFTYVVRIGS
ncbi:MAG TPA: class I SAM-dependent methyltransferase [Pseudonocardiaceae bacterium]|nr:class I SAM-dependent methyltransferase [Pseudonocardiaceae bacterium]